MVSNEPSVARVGWTPTPLASYYLPAIREEIEVQKVLAGIEGREWEERIGDMTKEELKETIEDATQDKLSPQKWGLIFLLYLVIMAITAISGWFYNVNFANIQNIFLGTVGSLLATFLGWLVLTPPKRRKIGTNRE
jgi:hypothetical protein